MGLLWNPVKPKTVTLTVECEEHDVALVTEWLNNYSQKMRRVTGDNLGPITVEIKDAS